MKKLIIVLMLLLMVLPVIFAQTDTFPSENPFPEYPEIEVGPDDSVLITEDDGITVGMLRLADLFGDLYGLMWVFINDCLQEIEDERKFANKMTSEVEDLKKVNAILTGSTICLGILVLGGSLFFAFR